MSHFNSDSGTLPMKILFTKLPLFLLVINSILASAQKPDEIIISIKNRTINSLSIDSLKASNIKDLFPQLNFAEYNCLATAHGPKLMQYYDSSGNISFDFLHSDSTFYRLETSDQDHFIENRIPFDKIQVSDIISVYGLPNTENEEFELYYDQLKARFYFNPSSYLRKIVLFKQ